MKNFVTEKKYSNHTIRAYKKDLYDFYNFINKCSISSFSKVNKLSSNSLNANLVKLIITLKLSAYLNAKLPH